MLILRYRSSPKWGPRTLLQILRQKSAGFHFGRSGGCLCPCLWLNRPACISEDFHILDGNQLLRFRITCNGVRVVLASMAPKTTPETSIQFQRYHVYMTNKLCILGCPISICMAYNSPVYHHVPFQSRWWSVNLDANKTNIVGQAMRQVDMVHTYTLIYTKRFIRRDALFRYHLS